MLYLEDYLEMIEHLPQELRDRFTEMREMDLSVQNNMDTLEKRVRTLFGSCRRSEVNTEQANTEFSDIKRGYNKTLEEADEKVALANQMYELVDRYLRKLDTELHKFKCELEADNKGITELLEKRSLELDVNTNHTSTANNNHFKDSRYRIRAEKRRESWASPREARAHAASLSRTDTAIQAALGRDPLNPIGQVGNAIAVAATQAIHASTHQMQHGRRTAALKASYEAVSGEPLHARPAHHDHGHGLAPSHSQSAHAHHTTAHAAHSASSSSSNKRHNKQKKTSYNASLGAASHSAHAASRSSSPTVVGMNTVVNSVPIEEPMEEEWSYDPNEPRYCICNQVSYGDMVACDNQHCPYEWFHYPCVGITAPPRGKWYCPQCQTNMRRNRIHRKN